MVLVVLGALETAARACQEDGECPDRQVCVQSQCRPLRRAALLYQHQPGPTGYRMVLPLYYSFWRPSAWTQLLFPLFFRQRETGAAPFSDLIIPPLLYQRRQEPGLDSHRVWPIFFWSRSTRPGEEGATFGLLPLFFGHRRGPRQLVVLPPLLSLDSRSPEGDFGLYLLFAYRSTTPAVVRGGLFPIFMHSHSRDGARHTNLALPLFFEGGDRRADTRHALLLPLFTYLRRGRATTWAVPPLLLGHSQDPERGYETTVAGPFYLSRTPRSVATGVVPLFFYGHDARSTTWAAPPLLLGHSHNAEGSTTIAGPFYHARRGEHRYGGLFPLFFLGKDASSTTWVAPPLLLGHSHNAEGSTTVAGPFYHARRGERRYGGLAPLFFLGKDASSTTWVAPPLLLGHSHNAEGSTTIAGPFYYARRGERRYGGLFPLVHVTHGGDATLVMATPLGWGYRSPTRSLTLGLPLFYLDQRRVQDEVDAGVLPLFFYGRRQRATTWVVPPLLFGHRKDPESGSETTVAGPFYLSSTPRSQAAGIAPLFFYSRDARSTTWAAPLLLLGHSETPAATTTVAGPFYYTRRGEQYRAGLAPLFFYGSDIRSRTWAVPPLLLGHRQDGEGSTTVAGPFYYARRGADWYGGLAPLLFLRGGPERTGVTLFPLFHRSTTPTTALTMITPLLWTFRSPERSSVLALPLFYFNRRGSDYTVVAPLLWHHRGAESSTTGLLPLFVYHRRPQSRTLVLPFLLGGVRLHDDGRRRAVFFPFFFHNHEGPEYTSTVFVPFLYHLRRPSYRVVVVFPLLANWQTASTSSTLVLNTMVALGRGESQGTWSFRFFPLLMVGHRPRPSDLEWSFLEGLIGYQHIGRYRTLRLFWIPIPLRDTAPR